MTGETVESAILPKQDLRPVRHVLVTEWACAHGMQYRRSWLAFGGFVIDPQGSAISVAFRVGLTLRFSKRCEGMNRHSVLEERTEVTFQSAGIHRFTRSMRRYPALLQFSIQYTDLRLGAQ